VVLAQGIRPSETYLPNTTAGFISLAHPPTFAEQFDKTQIGILIADPVMEPFRKDVRRQFEDRMANLRDHLSITIDDLEAVSGGEAALASIRPGPGLSAIAVVADVTGRVPAAKELLAKISADLTADGAKKVEQSVGDALVMVFQLPGPKVQVRDAPQPPLRQAVYCLVGELLMASDRLDVIEGMLRRVPKPQGDALADHVGFKRVMGRCKADAGDLAPQARWFIHPVHYADVLRTNTPPDQRRKGKGAAKLLQEQGFAAVEGVGGFVSLAAEDMEVVHRTAIYAPKPWELSMNLLGFENGAEFRPQRWVPREIATYSTFYFNVLNALNNFGPLYSEISGLKDPNAWGDAIDSLEKDPHGPQVNLRTLCSHLGPRITVITDYQVPITTTSERLLFALETKNEKAVAEAIEKLMSAEPDVKRRVIDGHIIWETVRADDQNDLPVVSLPTIGGGPAIGGAAPDEPAPLLPHAAVAVVDGHLFYASHIDFLIKVLKTIGQPDPLDRDAAYKAIEEKLATFGFAERCAQTFSFTDEEFRPTYELIRMNKLPEAETMLARALNTFSAEMKKGQFRKPRIDGRELPDYDVVRRHLGPSGLVTVQEKDGWFLKGCLLKKQ
jgi:hypothetical protein